MILYAELVPDANVDATVYDLLPVPPDIAKLLVTKLGFPPELTSDGSGDIAVTDNCVPIPAVVMYGELNRL
jgi:hypothetical protein